MGLEFPILLPLLPCAAGTACGSDCAHPFGFSFLPFCSCFVSCERVLLSHSVSLTGLSLIYKVDWLLT